MLTKIDATKLVPLTSKVFNLDRDQSSVSIVPDRLLLFILKYMTNDKDPSSLVIVTVNSMSRK